jgi:hypothetical protein
MTVIRQGIVAGAIAGVVSGAPSTVHALVTGGDPFAASEAAGAMLLPNETNRTKLLLAAIPVHAALSVGWAVVLAKLLPRKGTIRWGAAAGVAIATLDLGVFGGRFPRISHLPVAPQVLDHILYGAAVGAVLRGWARAPRVPAPEPGPGRAAGSGRPAWRTSGAARSARS